MNLPHETEFEIALHQRNALEIRIIVINPSPKHLLFLGEEDLLFGNTIRLHPDDGPPRSLNGYPVRLEPERPLPIGHLTEETGELNPVHSLGNNHPEEALSTADRLCGLTIDKEC